MYKVSTSLQNFYTLTVHVFVLHPKVHTFGIIVVIFKYYFEYWIRKVYLFSKYKLFVVNVVKTKFTNLDPLLLTYAYNLNFPAQNIKLYSNT